MEKQNFYQTLNQNQKEAVEQIEGPVMVIAGPGTGKTQILASRVAHILQTTDAKSNNILCLTYTDSGTIAMRKRLVTFIGNEGHHVAIHTFHSFCNRVIQENQEFFEYKSLDPITDLEKIELLTDIAINLPEDHVLKKMKGNVTYLVKTLSNLFDWMKKENVTSSEISQLVNQKKADLPFDEAYQYKRKFKEFNKGDANPRLIKEAEKKLTDLEAAAKLFDVYNKVMSTKNRYDYADMILWVIQLFESNKDALANYQERFQYILVDEFQDTSGAQNDVLHHLLSYWDKPNVFVVGDDDQSIYRFQGAEVKNVIDFTNQYGDFLKSIVLNVNYRSTQNILDASKTLINNNTERLINLSESLDKNLISNKEIYGNKVEVNSLENPYMEAIWITNEIKNKIASGSSPSDFAIIYANHSHGDLVAKLLHDQKVPVYLKKTQNIFDSDAVKQTIFLLNYIVKELKFPFSGEFELFQILHFQCFDIKPISLARASYFLNNHKSEFPSWRDLINEINSPKAADLPLTAEEKDKIEYASKIIENLIADASIDPVYILISKVIDKLNLSMIALDSHSYAFELECIISFLQFIETECNQNNSTDIASILNKIELMQTHNLSIPKDHIVYDKQGVNMLTAHASKGLEFKHVYIVQCVEKSWEKRKKHGLPFSLQLLFENGDKDTDLEELRRLFYVAATRAENNLNITYFRNDIGGKEVSRSVFVDEILESESCQFAETDVDPKLAVGPLSNVFAKHEEHPFNVLDAPFLDEYLSRYVLSVSHLNSYIECPTQFYFQNILRVPSQKNVYMSFGIAIHNTLDQLFKLYNEDSASVSADKIKDIYGYYLKKQQAVFAEKQYQDFLSLGKNILTEYILAKQESWKKIDNIQTEVMIDQVAVDGIPIKGQLDKIEFHGKMVNVVDYKTGDADRGRKKVSPPLENASPDDNITKRYGGTYWRQIMFYSLLVNNDKTKDYQMISGEMDFVEPIENGEFISEKLMINPENTNQIKNIVQEVYSRIMNKEFTNGCMKEECTWCHFVHQHH